MMLCLKEKSIKQIIHLKNVLIKHSTKWLQFPDWLCDGNTFGTSDKSVGNKLQSLGSMKDQFRWVLRDHLLM